MKKHLTHGMIAGILSALAGIIYQSIYNALFLVDFSTVVGSVAIVVASIIGCLFMAAGYIILDKAKKPNLYGALNFVIMFLSFLSILPAMTMKLPLDVDFPKLLPGLVVPMHFIPAMVYFGIAPFFKHRPLTNETN